MEGVTPQLQRLALDSNSNEETEKIVQDEGLLKDSTDSELSKIRLMRAFVETRDPSSKVQTNLTFTTNMFPFIP